MLYLMSDGGGRQYTGRILLIAQCLLVGVCWLLEFLVVSDLSQRIVL